MEKSTTNEGSATKADLLKSQRHQRRGAKGKFTRIGHALKSLIDGKRPISEVQEVYDTYLLVYTDLQNKHEAFSELIEDDDDFEKEESWMEECQQSFLQNQICFRDFCQDESEKNVLSVRKESPTPQEKSVSDPVEPEVCEETSTSEVKRVGSMFKMEKPKMPTFNGNVRDYCIFKADFQHALGEVYDERDALMILRSCLQGKPLQMIQGIGRDYSAAWEQLDMMYGDSRLVADAIIYDITKFRSLKPGEDDRFCEFVNIVRRSYNVLKEIGQENDMNNSHMLAVMEKKLTPEDRKIWFRHQESGAASATFERFLHFLTLEMKARMRSAAPVRGEVKSSVNVVANRSSPDDNEQEKKFDRCWICSDDSHWTDQCKVFLSKSYDDRMQLVRENKACFSCLKKATNGHRMSTCKRRRRCSEMVNGEQCRYYHHPLLHNTSSVKEVGVACVGAKDVILPVLTVEVSKQSSWKKCNMLLDCGAQVSIIKQSLADELQLEGKDITVVISKLGGVEEKVTTKEYTVSIREIGERQPVSVTVIGMPYISDRDNVSEAHLDSAAKQLKLDRELINRHGGAIDLLVGSDHPKLHGGESRESYNFTARHSPTGWVILGTLPQSRMQPSRVLHVQLAKPLDLTSFLTTESMAVRSSDCLCKDTGMTKTEREEYDLINKSCAKDGSQREILNLGHDKAYQDQMTQLVEMGSACSDKPPSVTAEEAEEEHAKVSQIVKERTYTDDICFSAPTEEEAVQLTHDIDKVLRDEVFQVKGWVSNRSLRPGSQNEAERNLLEKLSGEKVLEVAWNQERNSFSCKVALDKVEKPVSSERKWTKREHIGVGGRAETQFMSALSTCLNSRAVCLEDATDCSTTESLQALRRFFAARDQTACLISDNGKQAVGVERELQEMVEGSNADELREFCTERDTDCKLATKKALKEQCLAPFGLCTCLQEVTNLTDQRPIERIPIDPDAPDDGSYLCPSDIMRGRASSQLPQGPFRVTKNSCHHVELVQKIVDSFWEAWIRDVVPLLVPRRKWNVDKRNIRVNDVVREADSNAIRGKWTLGRIT